MNIVNELKVRGIKATYIAQGQVEEGAVEKAVASEFTHRPSKGEVVVEMAKQCRKVGKGKPITIRDIQLSEPEPGRWLAHTSIGIHS
jgi:hypothetical protein